MSFFSSFFVALLVCMLLVPLLMRYADALGLTDETNDRKVHDGVVPRCGGIAIVAGFVASMTLFWPDSQLKIMIVVGALIIALFGFLDDRSDLDYRWKFFGQIIASVLVVAAGLRIDVWPFVGIDAVSIYLSAPVTVIFLIGVTNAMNLSDGLDGLAAGASLITLAALAWLFWLAGNTVMVTFSMAAIGSVCGFLRFNNHPAVVFMGDTGSQFLGFITGCLAVYLCQRTDVALNPALLLLLVGLPILDTLSVMLWRIRTGRSPFSPDRNHFHHRLLDFGLLHYEAVSAIYVAQIFLVSLAVGIRYQGDFLVVGLYVLFALLVVGFFRWGRIRNFQIRASVEGQGFVERRNNWLRRFPGLPGFMVRITELLAAGFLIFAAIYSKYVPEQLGIGAAVMAALAMAAGVTPQPWRNNLFRVVIYITGIAAVYSLLGQPRFELLQNWHINAYMIGLGLCLVFSIRLTRREVFQTTPLDILIVTFVLAIVVASTLTERSDFSTQLADTAIRLAVFFYVSEYLSSRGQGALKLLPMAAMGALTILAARGLMAG
ncbi:MAG: glycosyltransferase family 4 protein [Gammaproteobacteria bacterium]